MTFRLQLHPLVMSGGLWVHWEALKIILVSLWNMKLQEKTCVHKDFTRINTEKITGLTWESSMWPGGSLSPVLVLLLQGRRQRWRQSARSVRRGRWRRGFAVQWWRRRCRWRPSVQRRACRTGPPVQRGWRRGRARRGRPAGASTVHELLAGPLGGWGSEGRRFEGGGRGGGRGGEAHVWCRVGSVEARHLLQAYDRKGYTGEGRSVVKTLHN